jgi:hypothetical protein
LDAWDHDSADRSRDPCCRLLMSQVLIYVMFERSADGMLRLWAWGMWWHGRCVEFRPEQSTDIRELDGFNGKVKVPKGATVRDLRLVPAGLGAHRDDRYMRRGGLERSEQSSQTEGGNRLGEIESNENRVGTEVTTFIDRRLHWSDEYCLIAVRREPIREFDSILQIVVHDHDTCSFLVW